ncbi:class I SAM-dependent methyltransferase [Archangium sp.]|uniref:class I SAM-dependent methyltransferase n=1 Tax=Archangium sp. TaxID=1872627 RepID=UPI002D732BEB|nr:methyltransferase domain-containing protein [Archangium sp.]HYO57703.1 methyltransferase domain-containing protein [Archangium sp.]
MRYIMESSDETRRLLVQERTGNAREALLLAGLKPGNRVLDAGCGPGGIAEVIAELVGPSGHVTGMDLSEERLAEARQINRRRPHVRFIQGDVRRTGLPDASFDFTWCQFVLQYVPDWQGALQELVRVTRPGGRVVISEIDGLGLHNFPFPESLREWSQRFVEVVARTTGFDIFAGRKFFTEMRRMGLGNVRVHLLPQYVIAGAADMGLMLDWETRFSTLEPVVASALGGLEAYRAMCQEYLQLLADPDALKYSVLLVTEGTRP